MISVIPPWPDELGLMLYAHGINRSDYVSKVAPPIRALGAVGTLLDVGAGAGQLGAALATGPGCWHALEPSMAMSKMLRARHPHLTVDIEPWERATAHAKADTVLAANISGPLQSPVSFLVWCRARARRRIVWLVPAQHGPRSLCLAGLLPPEWHGEDMTPGVENVLGALPAGDAPHHRHDVAWSFEVVIDDLEALGDWLAHRLGWHVDDPRRPALAVHLASQTVDAPGRHRLRVPKVSAILAWDI